MTIAERDADQARTDALTLALRRTRTVDTDIDMDPAWRRLERWVRTGHRVMGGDPWAGHV